MSGAAAFISAAMATDYNVTHPLTSSSNNSNYDEAIKTFMRKFHLVSSNSGGSWFSYAFLLSSTFNGVLKDMTQRYLEDQHTHLFRRNTGKENPFYLSFLAVSLKNINAWNEEIYDSDDMTKFKAIQQRFNDLIRKGVPVIGGDLALFLKHSFVEGNIWNSFVKILMSPLTIDAELPSWFKKVQLDWFINVTLNIPKLGPISTADPEQDVNDTSETRFRQHGSILRFIICSMKVLHYNNVYNSKILFILEMLILASFFFTFLFIS